MWTPSHLLVHIWLHIDQFWIQHLVYLLTLCSCGGSCTVSACVCSFMQAYTCHLFGLDMPPFPDPLWEQPSTLDPTSAKYWLMWTTGAILPNQILIASLISFEKVKRRINPNVILWNYKFMIREYSTYHWAKTNNNNDDACALQVFIVWTVYISLFELIQTDTKDELLQAWRTNQLIVITMREVPLVCLAEFTSGCTSTALDKINKPLILLQCTIHFFVCVWGCVCVYHCE